MQETALQALAAKERAGSHLPQWLRVTMHNLARDVAAAVHALDEPFRTVVMLRFWHDLLPEAIAERLRQRLDARHGDRRRWSAPLLLATGVDGGTCRAGEGCHGARVDRRR